MTEKKSLAQLSLRSRLKEHPRTVTFSAYLAVIVIVMCFHEPWFDEAQSWLIARDSSFSELLTLRPHYEGHPPLWTLILSIPAKTGVPYEIGLKSVQFLCAIVLGSWLIFRAPFNRLTLTLLPFTYFFCFQYGVTSRPYALLCTTLLMVAYYWSRADKKPSDTWKLTFTLILMCLLSAYGIALAAGFAIVWVLQTILKAGISKSPKALLSLFYDKNRLLGWILLAIVGVTCLVCIWPYPDAFGARITYDGNSPIMQFLAFFFVLPSESMFTQFAGDVSIRKMPLHFFPSIFAVILSIAIWMFAIRIARRRKTLIVLTIPYFIFSIIANRYFTLHHVGLIFVFFVAQLWICVDKKPLDADDVPIIFTKLWKSFTKNKKLDSKKTNSRLIVLVLLPSLVWNTVACVSDILFDYSGSRAIAQYVISKNAQHKLWMTTWLKDKAIYDSDGNLQQTPGNDTHQYAWQIINANPYFDSNLLSCSYQNRSFITNKRATDKQIKQEIENCAAKGEPDFFIFVIKDPQYYFKKLNYNVKHYNLHVIARVLSAWKAGVGYTEIKVYERKPLSEINK